MERMIMVGFLIQLVSIVHSDKSIISEEVLVLTPEPSVKYSLVKVSIKYTASIFLVMLKLSYHLNGMVMVYLMLHHVQSPSLDLVYAHLVVVIYLVLVVVQNLSPSFHLVVRFYSSLFLVRLIDGQHTIGNLLGKVEVQLRFLTVKQLHVMYLMSLVLVTFQYSVVLLNLSLLIQKKGNFYSHLQEKVKKHLLRTHQKELHRSVSTIVDSPLVYSSFHIIQAMVSSLFLEMPIFIMYLMSLVLDPFQYSTVQQNLLPSIQKKDRCYSPLSGNVCQRRNLLQRLDLETFSSVVHLEIHYLHLRNNHLVQFLYLERHILLHLYSMLVLVHSENLVVQRNLQHSIHKKEIFYSPLLEKELQNLQASAKLLLELCLDSVEHQRHLRLLTKLKVYSELQTKLWLLHLYSMSVLVLSESLLEQQNLLPSIQTKDKFYSLSLEKDHSLSLSLRPNRLKLILLVRQIQFLELKHSMVLEPLLSLVKLVLDMYPTTLDLVISLLSMVQQSLSPSIQTRSKCSSRSLEKLQTALLSEKSAKVELSHSLVHLEIHYSHLQRVDSVRQNSVERFALLHTAVSLVLVPSGSLVDLRKQLHSTQWKGMHCSDSLEMLPTKLPVFTLVLVLSENSVVQQRQLPSIQTKDKCSSPSLEMVQIPEQREKSVRVELSKHLEQQKFLSVLHTLAKVQFLSVAMLSLQEQETLLDLDLFQYSEVQQNLSPSTQQKEKFSSPSMESVYQRRLPQENSVKVALFLLAVNLKQYDLHSVSNLILRLQLMVTVLTYVPLHIKDLEEFPMLIMLRMHLYVLHGRLAAQSRLQVMHSFKYNSSSQSSYKFGLSKI
ncbi:MAG: hypothetical protein CMN91_12155 [Synechococcus sp. ARS1019]|nr:hypothetical protein [Synechococcus sp. ARS1019]